MFRQMNDELYKDIKAVLFDFNGTMFFDGRLHDKAWRETIAKHIGRDISDDEIRQYIYGCNNRDIVKHFFVEIRGVDKKLKSTGVDNNGDFDILVKEIAEEKEGRYRQLCMELDAISLAPGLPELLDRLKADGKQCAIVSAATKENIELYFNVFHLERWFTWKQIVYDDGTLPGKPEPDMWLAAADRLGVNISECIVCEDSLNGILAAKRAGAAAIFAVYGDASLDILKSQDIADRYIEDYCILWHL